MPATIRDTTPEPFTRPYLANPTFTDVTSANFVDLACLSVDRRTVYGFRGTTLVKSTNDGGTWTVIKDFGTGYSSLSGAWLLPNGEMLVSNKVGGSTAGTLTVSSGFAASDTAATWTVATVGGAALKMSRADNYVHGSWGLSFAPKGHPREGLVVATEYGGQSSTSDADTLSPKVWMSLDHGKTFRIVGDLFSIVGSRANQHAHGALYDPWDDRVLLGYGDGNGSGARTGIAASDTFLDAAPSWAHVYGPNPNADLQPTTMHATPAGIVMGGDGAPPGVYMLPRRGYRTYGPLRCVMNHGGGTDTGWIGLRIHQAAPGFPALICHQNTKTYPYPNVINATWNGVDFFELWRDTAQGVSPSTNAVGPTANGKIVATLKNDARTANNRTVLVADLIIP